MNSIEIHTVAIKIANLPTAEPSDTVTMVTPAISSCLLVNLANGIHMIIGDVAQIPTAPCILMRMRAIVHISPTSSLLSMFAQISTTPCMLG